LTVPFNLGSTEIVFFPFLPAPDPRFFSELASVGQAPPQSQSSTFGLSSLLVLVQLLLSSERSVKNLMPPSVSVNLKTSEV